MSTHHHLTDHFERAVAAIDVISEEQVIAHADVPLHVHVVDEATDDREAQGRVGSERRDWLIRKIMHLETRIVRARGDHPIISRM